VRICVYKCVVDDGGAPCVDGDLLTLAICKPYIRSTASRGDLIFAFGSNSDTTTEPNRLVYVAKVSRSIGKGGYYRGPDFQSRQDCIYEWRPDGRLHWRLGAAFHQRGSGMKSDLGKAPDYAKANALCCEDFRYFGKMGDATWKRGAPTLRALVEGLGQGHRVNFSPALEQELLALHEMIWQQHPADKKLGDPLHAPGTAVGNEDEDQACVQVRRPRCTYHCD